ncbi:retrovirus-related pol polyprotein from transposon TNT 1-94 [Tanacetum coccineum]
MINAMLVSANLPKNLWGEALLAACHACLAYYKVPLPNTSKLGPRALKSVFVGYAKDSKSYRCLDLDSNAIVESRYVDFLRINCHDSTSTNKIVTQIPQDIPDPNLNSNNKRNMTESSSAPRRSERARKERNLDPDFIVSQAIIFLVEGDNKNNVVNKIPVLLNVEDAPKTYKEAITSRNFAFWKEAIDNEMDSLVVLFVLASIYNLPIHEMVVKTAFLNGDLDEEVYKQPEGFVLPSHENKVCKLKKSLYGLKQAPKQWHDKFDKYILSNGFTHNSSDRCIYSNFIKDYGVILCLYVDDILIVGTNMKGINETKQFFSSCFQMKNMNEVDTILGIKVKRHSGGYALNQCHYIDMVIDKFQHLNIEEANTPYESSCKLVKNNGRAIAQIEYASGIGCLMYATHCTRPDIAYAICKLSRYTSNPSQDHWKAIGRVFGYLKRTRQLALYYDCFPAVLEGYSDAIWITNSSDSKSTTGWIFTLGGGAVCWGSKKQTCITHSTMEAKFLALAAAGKETEWLRNMLLDIELWTQPMPAIFLHCDSQSTLSRAYNKYIRSCKNLADPFKKGLPKDIVFGTTREIGYSDASWITGSSDSKSTTGWIFTLGGGAVCWGSKKQTCITHSTMEAEFLALAAAGKEAEWLRNMLLDIELWPQPMPAISLHCDSQSTLSRAYNKVYNGKSRHISLRHAYIKELISNGIITIEYIRSCKNLADPFTKGLPKDIVFGTTREMGGCLDGLASSENVRGYCICKEIIQDVDMTRTDLKSVSFMRDLSLNEMDKIQKDNQNQIKKDNPHMQDLLASQV